MLLAGDLLPQDIGSRIHVDGAIPYRGRLQSVGSAPGGLIVIRVEGFDLQICLWPDQLVTLDPAPNRPVAVAEATHDAEVHSLLAARLRKAQA